jgi:hypothetical protein
MSSISNQDEIRTHDLLHVIYWRETILEWAHLKPLLQKYEGMRALRSQYNMRAHTRNKGYNSTSEREGMGRGLLGFILNIPLNI